ncbi:MAG: PadR family transcriptional regulator [Microlunatus sp.]
MTERRTLVLRGVLDVCFLSVMNERPDYGQALATRLHEYGLEVAEGSIYSALQRLARAGLIEVVADASDASRKRYSLTSSGAAALREGRREWLGISSAIDACLRVGGGDAEVTTAC